MKIRCKNCYKVLKPLEEYCTFCGEHSEEIAEVMKNGKIEKSNSDKLKLAGMLFFIFSFLATGVAIVLLGIISEDSTQSLFNRGNAMFVTSMIMTLVISIVFRKELLESLWNGTKSQLAQTALLGILFIAACAMLSELSSYTQILPQYIKDYLKSDNRTIIGGSFSIVKVILSFVGIIIVEEIIFRKLIIDALDEGTLFSDILILIVTTIASVVLDFAWIMSPETLIVSIITSSVMSFLYMNTNRSILQNILIRVLLLVCLLFMYLIK